MNGELFYSRHPLRMRIYWAFVYVLIFVLLMFGVYKVVGRFRTHIIPVGQIQLTIPHSKYLVGEAVTFSIKNGYNSSIYLLNHCPSEPLAVYRQENGKWVRQHDKAPEGSCSNGERQISVPANGTISGSFAPWHNLFSQPGKYLVVAYVEFYNALPYQEFEIIALPTGNSSTPGTTTQTKQTKTITTSRGAIAVQYDATYINVTSITPASGCGYEGGNSGQQVQVKFSCPNGETQIQLNIVNGQLVPSVESGDG